MIAFGTDGWRGIIAADFTFANVRAVATAVGAYLQETAPGRECLVGYDHRFLAREMALAACQTLAQAGVPTRLADQPLPTPVLAHAVLHRQAGGAIMFTASHNPPMYQGMKFIPAYAGPATPEITQRLQEQANAVAAEMDGGPPAPGEPPAFDPAPDYWHHLEQMVDLAAIRRSGLRIAYDAMHGVGAPYMARLQPDPMLHATPDPLFGGMTPEPSARWLTDLTRLVQTGGADLGLANDGDADRFGAVDPVCGFLSGNQVLVLLAWYLAEVKGRRGTVARSIATTHLLDRIAAHYGLPVVETPVGFKYLAAVMREQPVLLAGEESGGLSVGGHIPEKDGILANLLLAELRAMTGRPLATTLQAIMDRFGPSFSRRLDLHLRPGDRERIAAMLTHRPPRRLADRPVLAADRQDGFRFRLEGGAWVLFRFSGTEPLVRIYAEAGSAEELDRLVKTAGAAVAP